MRFSELVKTVSDFLRDNPRVTYRALQREFDLDNETLVDLCAELIEARKVAIDEGGKVLVWRNGEPEAEPSSPAPATYTPRHLAERLRQEQQALEARGAAEGERKTITSLFADIKGSTALFEGLDPEVARAVIDPALRIMMDAVHRYEGYVAQALGDGILALFGAPLAHEDHAQRAVWAALQMQDELKRYSDGVRLSKGTPLAMRVGLNTGEVVVRAIRKDDLHADYVPVGHAINLAARMEQLATPGNILCTEYTARRVEGFFDLKPLGKAEIKGVEQPLAIFEVMGPGASRSRFQLAAQRGLTRFIGRQQELQTMRRALAQARDGQGQVICVMGEPGMGKSRLVHEFKLAATDFAVFEAFSASHGKASPYLPIVELLKGYFQIHLDDDERTRREKVIDKLLGLDRALADVLPFYFGLLNIKEPGSLLARMEPQVRRRGTLEAMKKVVLRASLEQPLLLIFEDLHWIDSETQAFLDGMVGRLGSARIVLLVNYRPEYRHEWGQKTYCTQIRLAPFGRGEAAEFLDELLGHSTDINAMRALESLKQWILKRTEGTPFFTEELVQELFEQGVLWRGAAGDLQIAAPASNLQVPFTVQGVLAARIDRLAPGEKTLLQQLAVIGRQFPYSLVQAVVDVTQDLPGLLSILQSKEFLYEQPTYSDIEYIFKHALTQEVAYHTLLHETRRAIHARIGHAIEKIFQAEIDDHYGDLAHHFSHSEEAEKALHYLELAGLQTAQRSALTDAEAYFERALELLSERPPDAARDRQELRLRLALWMPAASLKGLSSEVSERICLAALALSERVEAPLERLRALSQVRIFYAVRGEMRKAHEIAQAMLGLSIEQQDADGILQSHMALAVSHFYLGELEAVVRQAQLVREQYDLEKHAMHVVTHGADPIVLTAFHEGMALWVQGYADRALTVSLGNVEHARRLGNSAMLGMAGCGMVIVCMLRRETEICLREANAFAAHAEEHDLSDWMSWTNAPKGWALESLGDPLGMRVIEAAITGLRANRVELLLPLYEAQRASLLLARGDFSAAKLAIEAGLEIAQRNEEWVYAPELYRLAGELAYQMGNATQAETCFNTALERAARMGAPAWALRIATSKARLWGEGGQTADGQQQLKEALAAFHDNESSPDLTDARELLQQLGLTASNSTPP